MITVLSILHLFVQKTGRRQRIGRGKGNSIKDSFGHVFVSSLNSGNLIEDGSFKEDLIPYSAPEYWCASRCASAKMIHEKVFLVLFAHNTHSCKMSGKKIDHMLAISDNFVYQFHCHFILICVILLIQPYFKKGWVIILLLCPLKIYHFA